MLTAARATPQEAISNHRAVNMPEPRYCGGNACETAALLGRSPAGKKCGSQNGGGGLLREGSGGQSK